MYVSPTVCMEKVYARILKTKFLMQKDTINRNKCILLCTSERAK